MTETGSGVVYDGVPLDGVEVRLDGDGQILLRAPMLLRAYRDGTDPRDRDGWFATGDLGSWQPGGLLAVHGRAGDLIITGGENVWPEPVEAAVARLAGVADVAVAGLDDPTWGQRVVAFVAAGAGPRAADARRRARRRPRGAARLLRTPPARARGPLAPHGPRQAAARRAGGRAGGRLLSDTTTGPAEAAAKPRLTGAFWRLWTAGTISNLGDGVDLAALPLLAASLTRDPRLVAGMGVAFTLPWLLFALPAGAIVDRLDRRRVDVPGELGAGRARGLHRALGRYGLRPASGSCTPWPWRWGSARRCSTTPSQAMLPAIVHPSLLEVANGRQYAAEVVANTFVGPPLGGVLFAAAASVPFWLDSGSFLISALLIASLAGSFRPAPRPAGPGGTPAPRRSLRQDIAEGVHWLRRHRLLRTLALLLGAMNFASWLGMSTAVLFAQEILGLDDRGFGLLLAGMAVGGVIGGVFGPRIAAALGPGPALVMSIAAIGFSEAAVGLMSNAWAVAGLFWISGLFVPVWNIITVSLRQQIVPDHLLGRVNSVYRFLGWGLQPLGALAGGLLANAYGLRVPFLVGGAVTAVCLVLAWPRITTHAIEAAKAAAPVRAPA